MLTTGWIVHRVGKFVNAMTSGSMNSVTSNCNYGAHKIRVMRNDSLNGQCGGFRWRNIRSHKFYGQQRRQESHHNITISSGSRSTNSIVSISSCAWYWRVSNASENIFFFFYYLQTIGRVAHPGILCLAPFVEVPADIFESRSITIIPANIFE